MKISDKEWDNYNNESLDFILDQSEILIKETFNSFRAITDKCYYALGVYVAFLSYCFTKIIDNNICNKIPFGVMATGIVICIVIIFPGLMPKKMFFPGTLPEKLMTDLFTNTPKEDQLLANKAHTIVSNNNGIETNMEYIKDRINLFKISICLLVLFIGSSTIAYFSNF